MSGNGTELNLVAAATDISSFLSIVPVCWLFVLTHISKNVTTENDGMVGDNGFGYCQHFLF